MMVLWSHLAKQSFNDELEFIEQKWGVREVENFIDLVESNLNTLKSGILLGQKSKKQNVYFCVISKQTTLVYTSNDQKNQIE